MLVEVIELIAIATGRCSPAVSMTAVAMTMPFHWDLFACCERD